MRLALIHDWLNQTGGAEDVLENLVQLYPGAPVYTSMYWPNGMPPAYRTWDIRVSFIDRLPLIHRRHQAYLLLYPSAFESLDLGGYDLILSNKSGFCHGVRPPDGALHICYCLTPTRYVWGFDDYATREGLSPALRLALRPALRHLRAWDRAAAERVHHFVAISSEVQRRIARFYGRDSVVIYPPVDTARFHPASAPDDYYLTVGRLIPYKRVDLAVRACSQLGRPLVVGGDGRDRARLQALAGPSVRFVGRVPQADLPDLMARARAFIFPGLEDFGIAPVQAMAAGRPVIAYAGGGALDYVIDGLTGMLFREQTAEALADAIRRFESLTFDSGAIRKHAESFDRSVFERRLKEYVAAQYAAHAG